VVAVGAVRVAAQGTGALAGAVFDSLRARPLAGATVVLEGTAFSARTDSSGRFVIDSIAPGAYTVSVESAALDSLGIGVAPVKATIAAGARATVALGSPSRNTLVAMVCGGALPDDQGVLIGVVREAAGGKPADGATVDVEWTTLAKQNGGVVAQTAKVAAPVSNRGLYRACGVPAGGTVELRASLGARASGTLDVAIALYGLARRDLLIGGGAEGTLRGSVRDSAGLALSGARVALVGDSAFTTTDERGEFTLGSLPSGTHELEGRRVGYAPFREVVDITSGAPTAISITLGKPPTVLATVNVRGSPGSGDGGVEGFAARRSRGIGRFIDRKAIAVHGDVEALELLRGTPGIQVSSLRGVTVATWNRSGTGCRPGYFLDGIATDARSLPRATDIEAIEIYAPSEVPPQYAGGSARCAVVLFWTRRAAGTDAAARAPPDTTAKH
jgi:hypothetical protein